MNRNSWTTPQNRFGCAAAAALASTLVLSGVLSLFAGAAGTSASATPPQALVTADGRIDAERARVR
jgi:hypothetical protein